MIWSTLNLQQVVNMIETIINIWKQTMELIEFINSYSIVTIDYDRYDSGPLNTKYRFNWVRS